MSRKEELYNAGLPFAGGGNLSAKRNNVRAFSKFLSFVLLGGLNPQVSRTHGLPRQKQLTNPRLWLAGSFTITPFFCSRQAVKPVFTEPLVNGWWLSVGALNGGCFNKGSGVHNFQPHSHFE